MGDDWLKVMNAQTETVIEKNDNPPLKAKVKRINNNGTIDVSVDLQEQEIPWEIPGIPLTNNLKISKGDYVTVKFLENNHNSPVIDGMFNPKSYSGDGEDGRSILSVDKVESDGLVDIYRITYSKKPLYSYFQVKNGDNANITSISISDLNNAIETGFYNCYSDDNAPTSGFYTIEANTDGNNVIQTAKNANHEIYTRIGYDVQNNPSWGAWKTPALNQIIDLIYPVGSPFFSFLVTEDPNDRFPNTVWVRIEENTYLVSAGSNLVGMTPVGSNTKTLTTSNLPNHSHGGSISSVSLTTNSNSHSHNQYYRTSNFSSSGTQSNGRMGLTGDNSGTGFPTLSDSHSHSIDAHGHSLTINNNGSGESFDNRPKSLAIYMWRRTA